MERLSRDVRHNCTNMYFVTCIGNLYSPSNSAKREREHTYLCDLEYVHGVRTRTNVEINSISLISRNTATST